MATTGFTGRWKLNREKSDIPPVTQSQVLDIDTDGTLVSMCETIVNDKGETLTISVDGAFDGCEYPVAGTLFADTVSYRLLTPSTIEGVARKHGQVVVRETAVLSEDGQSIHVTYLTLDGEGRSFTSRGLFERVDVR